MKITLSWLFFIVLGFPQLAPAQSPVSIRWVLPLNQEITPMGKADQNFLHYRQSGKVYRIDRQGKKEPLADYDSISFVGGSVWQVWSDGLTGIWHSGRGELIPPVYDRALPAPGDSLYWAFSVSKYGMWCVVNDFNKVLVPWGGNASSKIKILGDTILEYPAKGGAQYYGQNGTRLSAEQVAWAQKPEFKRLSSDSYQYTSWDGGKPTQHSFQGAEPFENGLAAVRKDTLWGFIKPDGSWQIKPAFQLAKSFNSAGHAIVKKGNKYGVIRRDGSVVMAPKYGFLKAFNAALYETKDGDKLGLCDTSGVVVLPPGDYGGFVEAGSQAFGAKLPSRIQLFRNDGTEIPLDSVAECRGNQHAAPFWATVEKLDANKRKKRYTGLLSPEGQWLIPPVLTGYTETAKHFLFAANQVSDPKALPGVTAETGGNSRKLIFNREGKAALNFSVDVNSPGDNPVCIFKHNQRFGLVSPLGLLLQPEYEEINALGYGWYAVRNGQRWGVVCWE